MGQARMNHAVCAAIVSLLIAATWTTAAPVAAYRLDELSGTTAIDSAGSNDGSLINPANVTQGVGGVFGTAYDYQPAASGGGVNLGTSAAVQPNDDFTITFWFNADVLNDFDRFIESMAGSSTGPGLRIDLGGAPGDSVRVLLRDGTGATGHASTKLHSLDLSINQWYFVAVRFDKDNAASGLQLSVLDSFAAPSAANINSATQTSGVGASMQTNGVNYEAGRPTVLGVENSGGPSGNAFNGRMDDVAFYAGVLTDAEVNFVRRFGSQTVMPTIAWDAADPETALTTTWASNIGDSRTFNLSAGDSTVPTVVGVTGTTYRIPKAYEFFGGTSRAVIDANLPDRNQNATFEIWVRPNDLTGQEVLFEAGGDASGFSILLDGADLKLRFDQDGVTDLAGANFLQVTHTLTAADIADFMQIVARIDLANDTIELLLNGVSVGSVSTPNAGSGAGNITSWAGGNPDAIGSISASDGNSVGGDDGTDLDSFSAFEGFIGVVRFYGNQLLTDGQIVDNYNAMLIPEPASMTLLLIGACGMLRRRR